MAVVGSTVVRWSRFRKNAESPTLLVVCSTNHIWYGRRIPESLRYEHGKPHTVSSLFNHIWYGRRIQPYMVRSSHSRKFTLRTRKAPHC